MIPHSKPSFDSREKSACLKVLDSHYIAQGPRVREFEKKFAAYAGRKHAVAVSSGSSALHLSLIALGIGTGDEVILPSYNCAAILHAVDSVHAKPVVVDIDPEDSNISVRAVRRKISKRTRLILVPHLFGRAAQIDEIASFGIPVLEDGTQALGAKVGKKRVGSFGALSVFSLYATKMITTGEGGMILTDSGKIADAIRDMRDYDKRETYRFRTNSKMTDLEAAIGIEQLKKLPSFVAARRKIAKAYDGVLREGSLMSPTQDSHRDHVYFRYVVKVSRQQQRWLKQVRQQGLDAKQPVYKPVHQYLKLSDRDFSETALAMRQNYSIPIFPTMNQNESHHVCRILHSVAP